MSIAVKVAKHGPMTFVGRVTKAGVMSKTVTVVVDRVCTHPKTHKRVTRSSKFLVHDPENKYRIEDRVRIVNVPRFSKHKAFEVKALLERGWEGRQADNAAAAEESARRQKENSSERRQA